MCQHPSETGQSRLAWEWMKSWGGRPHTPHGLLGLPQRRDPEPSRCVPPFARNLTATAVAWPVRNVASSRPSLDGVVC
jgi:hypothetical protein